MHEGGSDAEILRELIAHIHAKYGLPLLSQPVTSLQGNVNRGFGVEELFVEYPYLPLCVVHAVVFPLLEESPPSHHPYRALCNVRRT